MKKAYIILLMLLANMQIFAKSPDYYNDCVAQYKMMNNSVVSECSELAQEKYQQHIDISLNAIKQYSIKHQQSEKYQNILKAQHIWKKFIEIECQNAGNYIGSPMYSYCPMQYYKERAERLKEYIN